MFSMCGIKCRFFLCPLQVLCRAAMWVGARGVFFLKFHFLHIFALEGCCGECGANATCTGLPLAVTLQMAARYLTEFISSTFITRTALTRTHKIEIERETGGESHLCPERCSARSGGCAGTHKQAGNVCVCVKGGVILCHSCGTCWESLV